MLLVATAATAPNSANSATSDAIAAQPLGAALQSLIAQTHLNLLYVSRVIEGKRSAAVPAGLDGMAALRALLAGTGLEVQPLTSTTVRLVPARRVARAAAAAGAAGQPAPTVAATAGDGATLEEILVTATRREEPLGRIPMSVLVIDPEDVRAAAVGGIADIASAAPGFGYSYDTEFGSVLLTHTVLRGISTDKGSQTLGVFLGDTPLQMPLNPFRTPWPLAFDMDRIELLRGPQSTYFGTHAMGGTVRFVPTRAAVDRERASGWVDGSVNEVGGLGHSVAVTGDLPLVQGQLGAHLALLQQRDAGYVDRVSPFDGHMVDAQANHSTSRVAHLALDWQPGANWRFEPDLWFQSTTLHDTPVYYVRGYAPAGDPTFAFGSGLRSGKLLQQPTREQFWQASFKASGEIGRNTLELSAAFFDRANNTLIDQTNAACIGFFGTCGNPLGAAQPADPAQAVATTIDQHQQVANLEARISGDTADGRFSWLVGAMASRVHTRYDNATVLVVQPGEAALDEQVHYTGNEFGAFGNLRWRLAPAWSLGAGTRVGQRASDYVSFNSGYLNTDGTRAAHGPWGAQKADPRFDLSYEPRKGAYWYAAATKGTREGGHNANSCPGDGLPADFGSDAVWNYELGAKLAAPDGHLAANASVFYIRWNGVQDQVLNACGQSITANLGQARSRGFDLDLQWRGSHWDLLATLGYADARFTRTVLDAAGRVVALDGAVLGAFPTLAAPWSGRLSGGYRWGRGWYARGDGRFQTRNFGPYTGLAPNAAEPLPAGVRADPGLPRFSASVGRAWGPWDLRLAVENVTDRQPQLQANYDGPGSTVVYASTWAPRTVHLRLAYRAGE